MCNPVLNKHSLHMCELFRVFTQMSKVFIEMFYEFIEVSGPILRKHRLHPIEMFREFIEMLHPVKKTNNLHMIEMLMEFINKYAESNETFRATLKQHSLHDIEISKNYKNNYTEFNHMSNLLFKQHSLHTMEMSRKLVNRNIEFNEQCIPILISTACARLKGLGHACKGVMNSWKFEKQIIEMSYPMLRKHNLYTTATSSEFVEMSNQLAQDWNV